MKYILRNTILIFATMLLYTISAIGQSNLSGTWGQQKIQHISGPNYQNAIPAFITISFTSDSLFVQTKGRNTNAEPFVFSVPINGQSVTTEYGRKKRTRTFVWKPEKNGFILTTLFFRTEDLNQIDFTRVEKFQLSNDGRELTLEKKSIETRSEDWHTNAVFVKN